MRLSLSGPAPRLVAAGEPDLIATDGRRIGWSQGRSFFLLDGNEVIGVDAGGIVESLAPGKDAWVIATDTAILSFDPTSGQVRASLDVEDFEPVRIATGADSALVIAAPEHHLFALGGQPRELAIPDAATRARFAAPFATGEGLVWIDLDTLFRMTHGALPNALGRVSKPEAIAVGPQGSTLVQLASDTVIAAPRALTARLGSKVDVASARFSADGMQALVADEDGVALLDLAAARELRRWDGDFLPVGFRKGPLLLDAEGRVVDGKEKPLFSGFSSEAGEASLPARRSRKPAMGVQIGEDTVTIGGSVHAIGGMIESCAHKGEVLVWNEAGCVVALPGGV